MTARQSYLIVGNGIAGATAAEILRNEDAASEITVVADDPCPVYYRPALKDYLAGKIREDNLWARPISFYQDRRIRFLTDRVVGIQAGQHIVQLRARKIDVHVLAPAHEPEMLEVPHAIFVEHHAPHGQLRRGFARTAQ